MGIIDTLMRVFSYVFHLLLAIFLVGLTGVRWLSDPVTFQVGVLPWQGNTLGWVLVVAAAAGVVSVWLAWKRILPAALLVWSLVVLAVLVRGFFFSSYRFGREGAGTAVWLITAAALALLGSWGSVRGTPARTGYQR